MEWKEDEECNGKHITHLFIHLCIDFILVSHSHYIQFKFKVLIFLKLMIKGEERYICGDGNEYYSTDDDYRSYFITQLVDWIFIHDYFMVRLSFSSSENFDLSIYICEESTDDMVEKNMLLIKF